MPKTPPQIIVKWRFSPLAEYTQETMKAFAKRNYPGGLEGYIDKLRQRVQTGETRHNWFEFLVVEVEEKELIRVEYDRNKILK